MHDPEQQSWRDRYGKGNSEERDFAKRKSKRTRIEKAARGNSDVQKYIYFQQFQNHCLFLQ